MRFTDESPPPRRETFVEVARNLRSRPGVWATRDYASGKAAGNARRRIAAIVGDHFGDPERYTFRVSSTSQGAKLWAIYEEDAPSE